MQEINVKNMEKDKKNGSYKNWNNILLLYQNNYKQNN
jgi:hypothetical protein